MGGLTSGCWPGTSSQTTLPCASQASRRGAAVAGARGVLAPPAWRNSPAGGFVVVVGRADPGQALAGLGVGSQEVAVVDTAWPRRVSPVGDRLLRPGLQVEVEGRV